VFSSVGVLAYGVYETSGHVNYTGLTPATAAGRTALGIAALPGSTYNGNFDNLNFGNGGLALTYAGFTIGGNIIGGRLNGQLALAPQHGVGEIAYLVGAKYVSGPFTVGVAAERGDYQGSVNLTGISQRRGQAIDFGMGYTVAPGFLVYAEYQYQTLRQTGFDFITNTNGSNANNTIKSQGFLIGNVVNF
jgi:predicted porin